MGQPQTVGEIADEPLRDELEPGRVLMDGQYTIESFLSSGGFGITYLAQDSLDRKVVIKECFPGSFCRRTVTSVQARSRSHTKTFSAIVSKFVDEAHSLAKVKHPNIVGVHQVFKENNTAYMVLDFVEGSDLLDVIEGKAKRPEPAQFEVIFSKMLDAIGSIHELDMLHRDISPDNILLTPELEPILIDFGAAREDIDQEDRALSEMRVIKDGYSPQEFYVAGAEQGPSSDLYALAATIYHLITGELPTNSQTRLAAVASGESDPYQPLAKRFPKYSERFLSGVDQALEILPKNRIQTAGLWLDFLNGDKKAKVASVTTKSTANTAVAPPSESGSKTKMRLLGAIALTIPIIGGYYALQLDKDVISVGSATETLSAAEASSNVATTANVAVPTDSATPATDLTAALSLPTASASAEADTLDALGLPSGDAAAGAAISNENETPATDLTAALSLPTVSAPAEADTLDALGLPSGDAAAGAAISNENETPATDLTAALSLPTVSAPVEVDTLDALGLPSGETVADVPVSSADATPETDLSGALNLPAAPSVTDTLDALGLPSGTAEPSILEDTVVAPVEADLPLVTAVLDAAQSPVTADAEIAAPSFIVESFDLPSAASFWSVDLTDVAPVVPGAKYAINGVQLDGDAEIDTLLHQSMPAPETDTVELSILAGESDGVIVNETITVPVIHKTSFPDGSVFEARMLDGVWTTLVAEAPYNSEFQVGGVLVGDLVTEIDFNSRTSLPDTLVHANAQDIEKLTLAIRRDGIMSPAILTIPR